MKTRYTLPVVAATAAMVTPIYAYAGTTEFDFSFTGDGNNTVTGELFFADTSAGVQTPTDVVITSGGNVSLPTTPFDMVAVVSPTNYRGGFAFNSSGSIVGAQFRATAASRSLVLGGFDGGTNRLSYFNWSARTGAGTSNHGGFPGATYTEVSAPEPASIALLGAGIAGIASFRRRRARA